MELFINLVLTILAACFFGSVVGLVYNLSHSRAVYSKKMQVSLLIYTVIIAMMLFLDFYNGGIAVIGAITIMRFREPVKDHRDLIYIFWSAASGFACVTHQFVVLGILSSILIFVLVITKAMKYDDRFILVVRGKPLAEENILKYVRLVEKGNLRMKFNNSINDSYTELIYEVKNSCKDKILWCENFKKVLYSNEDIEEVNIIYQRDDIGI